MNRFEPRVAVLLVVVLGITLGYISLRAMGSAGELLVPEVAHKAETIARSTVALTERALEYGIPLPELVGVEELFAGIITDNPELAYAALTTDTGEVLVGYGTAPTDDADTVSFPVRHDGTVVARLAIGIDPAFIQSTFRALWLDMAIIAIVSALIALELSALAFGRRFGTGHARSDRARSAPLQQAGLIRAPLFLFMLAEELTRPFLPGYIAELTRTVDWLTPELVISLPIVLFMAIVALAQPVLGSWTECQGRGRSLCQGALLAMLGFIGTAVAYDLLTLLLFRGLTAVGFALVFVAAQGHIIDHTDTRQRGRGLAVFVGAIMVAALCGPPLGGILAERLGAPVALLVSAALVLCSLLLAWTTLPRRMPVESTTVSRFRFADLRHIAGSPALLVLLFGCALPAKMILAALCFYLVPLHLQLGGVDQATIGRMLMLYPLAMVVLVPLFAGLADRWQAQPLFVVGGGLLAAAATAWLLIGDSLWLIALMLLQLGIAQALSIAPQSALVGTLGRRLNRPVNESALYGIFRLIERSGNALGPALAGAMLAGYGFVHTATTIGGLVAIGALLFLLLALRHSDSTGDRRSTATESGV